jgi:hypothetical protein
MCHQCQQGYITKFYTTEIKFLTLGEMYTYMLHGVETCFYRRIFYFEALWRNAIRVRICTPMQVMLVEQSKIRCRNNNIYR